MIGPPNTRSGISRLAENSAGRCGFGRPTKMETRAMAGRRSREEIMVDKDAPVTTLANNPEIQKLISDAVAKQVHEFAKSAGASMPGDDKRFASDLAEAIAVMANQGAGGRPKPVSPELMAARAE